MIPDTLNLKEASVITQYKADNVTTDEQKIFQGTLTSQYKTGSSASAIYGKLDYKDTGSAHGMAQGITAEAILPNMSLTRGQVNAIDLEIGGGASTSWGSAGPVCFIRMGVWGAGSVAEFNAGRGYIIDIQGLTSSASGAYDATQAPANTNASIKIRVGTTDYWIPMSTTAS